MPTLHFLFYLLAIALAYLFRLTYLGWFGPFFMWCVITVPLMLLLLSLPSMLRLRIRPSVSPYITKDRDGKLFISVHTEHILSLCRVRIMVEVTNCFTGEVYLHKQTIRCLGTEKAEIPLHTELCGLLICRVKRWECRDVLGLFAIRRKYTDSLKCTIVPPVVGPDQPIDIDTALETAVAFKPKYGGGYSEEHDLREYRPGDTVNSIHWKLSSKTDEIIVREPLEQENNRIYLVLSRVGANDRGLEVLYWLSLELCRREMPHIIVANAFYPVGNETEAAEAMTGILSTPMGEPCRFDASSARCVFRVSCGEVLKQ